MEIIIIIVGFLCIAGILMRKIFIIRSKRRSKKLVFSFLLFIKDKYNEIIWPEIIDKYNAKNVNADIINNELRKKTEKMFQNLIQKLYYFPDDYWTIYYEPHTHIFIKEICPKLKYVFLIYKTKKVTLNQITELFYDETYELILSKVN